MSGGAAGISFPDPPDTTQTSDIKFLDQGVYMLQVLTWEFLKEDGVVTQECFAVPLMPRRTGVLLAIPMDFLPKMCCRLA